jgi:MoxR-like ATPase
MSEIYTGDPSNRREGAWRDLPRVEPEKLRDPAGYITDPGARDAVRVALTLGQPLLLTGHPGSGKTLLASAVAHELGLDGVLKYETKSSSVARDLFYRFDHLGRLNAIQTKTAGSNTTETNPVNFVTYSALGQAILYANPAKDVAGFFPQGAAEFQQRRSVVLIDEVDKAPRDVPNDILNEIEEMFFRVPELGNLRASATAEYRPIVFVTSNSEKGLPDAFLRRCVYYHMQFPDPDRLKRIVESRIGRRFTSGVVSEMVAFFEDARTKRGLRRAPGVAELLMWFSVAVRRAVPEEVTSLRGARALLELTRSTLFRTPEDTAVASQMIEELAPTSLRR